MNKDRAATLLTVLLLAGFLIFTALHRTGSQAAIGSEATPQDAIYAMFDAARSGDTRAYLSHYSGRMKADLTNMMAEKTDSGFRAYLQSSNAEIKGFAIAEPKTISAGEVEARVEYVYQDRNEVQKLFLEKQSDGWKIIRVESAERIKTTVPYGTPVQ